MEVPPELLPSNSKIRRFIEEYAHEFPIPGLPADIIREIARKDPEAYLRLLLLSKKVKATVEPVLPELCNRSITKREIINYLKLEEEALRFNPLTPLYPYRRDDSNSLLYREASITGNLIPGYYKLTSITVTENNYYLSGEKTVWKSSAQNYSRLESLVDLLINEGYQPNIYEVYKILYRRTSCSKGNPEWALDRTVNIIRDRYRDFLDKIKTYPPELLNEETLERLNYFLRDLLICITSRVTEELDRLPTEEGKYLYLVDNFNNLIQETVEGLRRNLELPLRPARWEYNFRK